MTLNLSPVMNLPIAIFVPKDFPDKDLQRSLGEMRLPTANSLKMYCGYFTSDLENREGKAALQPFNSDNSR
jgi:hypothetical protein